MRALGVCFVHTVLKFSLVPHLVPPGSAWCGPALIVFCPYRLLGSAHGSAWFEMLFVHTVLKFSLVWHLVRLGAAWRLLCFVHTVCLVWHLVWLGLAWCGLVRGAFCPHRSQI